jgi:hypothetical protein
VKEVFGGVRSRLAEQSQLLRDVSGTNLASLLTTLILLRFHEEYWYVAGPLTSLMAAGLIWPRLRKEAAFWLAALAVVGVAGLHNWYSIDNHQYLLIYWCLALFLASLTSGPFKEQSVATASSLMLGLVMALATCQKLFSGSYVNGSFFEYMLLRDHRFESVSWLWGGVPLADLRLNRVLEARLLDASVNAVTLHATARIRVLALLMSWLTLLIEGTLAVLFLMPRPGRRAHVWRASALIGFVLATYAVAPVVGFGWLLIAMGVAQLPPEFPRLRATFVGVFVFLPIFKVPLAQMLPAVSRLFDLLRQ